MRLFFRIMVVLRLRIWKSQEWMKNLKLFYCGKMRQPAVIEMR